MRGRMPGLHDQAFLPPLAAPVMALKLAWAWEVAWATAFCTVSIALEAAETAFFMAATICSLPAGAALVMLSKAAMKGCWPAAPKLWANFGQVGVGRAARDDLDQFLAVGHGALGHRLEQVVLQVQQFLRVLGAGRGLGQLAGVVAGRLGRLQVEVEQLLTLSGVLGLLPISCSRLLL